MNIFNESMQFTDVLLAMGLGWTLSGILLLLSRDRRNEPSTPRAIFVLGVFGLTILDNLLHLNPHSDLPTIVTLTICRPSYFLVGPALWFYIRSLLDEKRRCTPIDLLHLLPYLIQLVLFARGTNVLGPAPTFRMEAVNVNAILTNLSLIIYSIVLFRTLQHHLNSVPDTYSTKDTLTTLSWLRYLTILYLASSLLKLIGETLFLPFIQNNAFISALRYIPPVLFVLFFLLFSKRQKSLEETTPEAPVSGQGQKYCKSGMSELEGKKLYAELQRHMSEKRAYMDPELTLSELAEQMGETRHRISEVINREAGKNFYGFVNDFRLEATMEALKTDRFPNYTILAVANEFGFKSSSVFYALFKKKYGKTPKEFLEKAQGRL